MSSETALEGSNAPPPGKHVLVDLAGCPREKLADARSVLAALREAAVAAGATIVGEAAHQFAPSGASAVVLVGESHLSAHTWPEDGVACLDVFTCSDRFDARGAAEHLARALGAQRSRITTHARHVGGLAPAAAPSST